MINKLFRGRTPLKVILGGKHPIESNGTRLKIICVNGPPNSGKDSVGKIIKSHLFNAQHLHNVRIDKFAAPLDRIVASILNIDLNSQEYKKLREVDKDRPLLEYGISLTMRELLISVSEDLIKPKLGKTWFAEQAINRVTKLRQFYPTSRCPTRFKLTVVFTDSGFQYEYDRLRDAFKSTADVHLVQVRREGCTFEGDSRHDVTDTTTHVIDNNGSPQQLTQEVGKLLKVLYH